MAQMFGRAAYEPEECASLSITAFPPQTTNERRVKNSLQSSLHAARSFSASGSSVARAP